MANIYEDFNVTRFEGNLKNGIKIVLFRRPAAPVATYAILKSGSRYDSPTMYGAAHFIEHMIVNGSPEFPSKDLLAEHIESVGGVFQAKTSQDPMWVNTEVSDKSDYSRVADIYKATLCSPLMDKNVFENEKQVVIKEIQRNNSKPDTLLAKVIRTLFFQGTPFEHQVVGYEESISSLNYEEILAEHKKLFDKSRITFVVSGDISIEEVINNLDTLPFIVLEEYKNNNSELEIPSNKTVLTAFFDTPQTHIYFGVPSPKVFTKEWSDLSLLGNVLAGGRTSRLMKRLRYKNGLVYMVNAMRFGGLDFGCWGIATDTTTDKVQVLLNEIIEEIKDIQNNGIKDSELEFVKNKRLKSLKRELQTSDRWVDFHALAETFSPGNYDLNKYIEYTLKASIADMQNIISKYLPPAHWKLALVGKNRGEEINISW